MNGALRYIDLLKLSLIDLLGSSTSRAVVQPGGGVRIEQVPESERGERLVGRDWPAQGTTMIGLENLYSGVSPGGFVIVDDYGAVAGCRRAVDDFRQQNGIHDELGWIDWTGVMWRKSAPGVPERSFDLGD